MTDGRDHIDTRSVFLDSREQRSQISRPAAIGIDQNCRDALIQNRYRTRERRHRQARHRVRVRVDEPWRNVLTRSVDDARRLRVLRDMTDRHDPITRDPNVSLAPGHASTIKYTPIANDDIKRSGRCRLRCM